MAALTIPAGRYLLGLALIAEGVPLWRHASEMLGGGAAAPAFAGLYGLHLLAVAAFVRGLRPELAGVAALVLPLCGWAAERFARPEPDITHGMMLPVGVLLALLAPGFAGAPPEERAALGHEAACGVAGAVYVTAGLTKLIRSGTEWFDPNYLAMLILERGATSEGALQVLRFWVAERPWLCLGMAVFALVAELGGVLWLLPRARRPLALLLASLHLGIAALMGYFYFTWALLLIGLAWSTPALADRRNT